MIVRIMGEGQFTLDDSELDALNVLDDRLEKAVHDKDDAGFHTSFDALLEKIRSVGGKVADDFLGESTIVLPPADASRTDVEELLADDGLIPG
jgi:hypothetical protein